MLFNSYEFLLLFLPVCVLGFFWLGRTRGLNPAVIWLSVCSIAFYAWWDWRYTPLLLGSIAANAFAGQRIVSLRGTSKNRSAHSILIVAVTANLVLLGYFKYANFFLDTISAITGSDRSYLNVVLPIGISFFTFTQIAYLVDAWRGEVAAFSFSRYLLFVTYFPHLIAGPILHHREMMAQFASNRIIRPRARNFAIGLSIFSIGLFKKVIIADNIAVYASPLFAAASRDAPIAFFDAWAGSLAYSFQLYFDFSAYSDMAIGLSMLFGIRIPLNFNSPYRATSIIDFWRRWHMSLSRFLRDYLYIALGGGRCAPWRRHINLLITMLLGGLWHGAGWTYVVWGGLHGIYLMVNHAWRARTAGSTAMQSSLWSRGGSIGLTFIAVTFAWVFFRADSLEAAIRIVQAMIGFNGIGLPSGVATVIPDRLTGWLSGCGVSFDGMFLVRVGEWKEGLAWIAFGALLAFGAPNTYQLFARFRPALPIYRVFLPERARLTMTWNPSQAWAAAISALFVVAFLALYRPSEFLYFQF